MAEGEKWSEQPAATSFASGDKFSILQGGDNKTLDKDLLIQTFSTGWVANSDWTNAELTATHNFATNLSDLIVKFFISSDGTEANALECSYALNEAGSRILGFAIYQVNTNGIKIQTASDGIGIVDDDGSITQIDTESWYYKIKVYKIA